MDLSQRSRKHVLGNLAKCFPGTGVSCPPDQHWSRRRTLGVTVALLERYWRVKNPRFGRESFGTKPTINDNRIVDHQRSLGCNGQHSGVVSRCSTSAISFRER